MLFLNTQKIKAAFCIKVIIEWQIIRHPNLLKLNSTFDNIKKNN